MEEEYIRIRFNTMAAQTPNGVWRWRVVCEKADGSLVEHLAIDLVISVSSFTTIDNLPDVGTKYHIGCRGVFTLDEKGIGFIKPKSGEGNYAV